ncbi:hypothetical protein OEW28_05950 [Defluviimonas sp. WL0002]|uniref:Chromosome partition protein Smc n=1 Tax=Albidovulum marisflavi TaxID=2984159 RepID=A0ABT2ZAM2_9RHOB|nr:hypothetical protein [Defluviimonas sp. WL0002]MCV2868167.1 hypothetical protein [Defluviimonas sp. WL0002]
MPFSSLDPKAQKFVKKYFKSGGLFGKGTSQVDKDRMSDEYQAYQDACAQFSLKIQNYPPFIGTKSIVKSFDTARDSVDKDKKQLNAAAATQEIGRLSTALETLGQTYVNRLQTEAQQAVTRMQALRGTVIHRQKAEARLVELRNAGARTPPDFDAVRSAHAFILGEETRVTQVSNAYMAEYNKYKGWPQMVRNRYPEINDAFVSTERQEVERLVALAEQQLDEHSISVARSNISIAWGKVDAAKRLLDNRADYELVKAAAETEINKLLAKRCPGVEEECAEIVRRQGEAATAVAARDFITPWHIMQDLKKRAVAELPFAQGYLDFEAAAKTASEAISALASHPQGKFALGQIAEARSVFAQAEALAGVRKYAQAVARLDLIPDMCKAAAENAAAGAPFTRLEEAVGSEPPERIISQAEALIKSLEAHPRAAQIAEAIADLKRRHKAADEGVENFDDDTARSHLKELAELASGARRLADIVDALMTRADRLIDRITNLRDTHGQAKYAETSLKTALETAKQGREAAEKGNDAATGMLDRAEAALDRARMLADGQEVYLIRRAEVKSEADKALKQNFPDKPGAQGRINDAMLRAEEFSKGLEPAKAKGALDGVMAEVASINIAAKAKAGTPPTKQEVLDIIAQPNGQRMLDGLIEQLGPNDVTQEVMMALLGARFDMEVGVFDTKAQMEAGGGKASLTGPAPNLLKYYKMMTKVPDAHTKLNESLLRFDEVEQVGVYDSFYQSGKRQVVMGLGGAMDWGSSLSDPDKLEDIEPDCVCVPDTEKPQPTYGTWTTLHEIGHAVDDAKGFMKGKAGNAAFGGWTEYGGDIRPIAKAVAAEYKYDEFYVERLISGGAPEDPEMPEELKENPNGATAWSARKQNVDNWYKAMSTGSKPWDNKRASSDYAIGGKVYHEAYGDTWVSYDAGSRRQGVTGYQFRAPGEWFSELYAAYHTGKLNPKHPAAKWLSTL